MNKVTMRELRNHGGDVVNRILAGETLLVTRFGEPVAELVPLRKPSPTAEALVAGAQHLPRLDSAKFRREVDALLDTQL